MGARGILDLYDFHVKMYDARWNGESDLYVSFKQLEDDFVALATEVGLGLEKINEMFGQLYIPPYQYDMLPEHLKNSNSAYRERAGRPTLGVTKKVSITLPSDIWGKIEREISGDEDVKSMSAYFRKMALDHFKGRV
ncbi:hypothetical protein [Mesobacillus sp.]|uniref:hypothetical protein n=1 Tax=Mesobacillus sp. TaxID=2675271 RepID=UPI0039EE6C31